MLEYKFKFSTQSIIKNFNNIKKFCIYIYIFFFSSLKVFQMIFMFIFNCNISNVTLSKISINKYKNSPPSNIATNTTLIMLRK